MTDHAFTALEARTQQRTALREELDAIIAQIRPLQRRRIQIETQIRQSHRAAREWREQTGGQEETA